MIVDSLDVPVCRRHNSKKNSRSSPLAFFNSNRPGSFLGAGVIIQLDTAEFQTPQNHFPERVKVTRKLLSWKPRLGRNPLVRSVHFNLFWRLSIAGLVIGAILSLLVYFSERENVTRQLTERAQQVTHRFNQQIQALFDDNQTPRREVISQSLKMLLVAHNIKNDRGQLVYVAVYDDSGRELGAITDEKHYNISAVKSFIGQVRKQLPAHQNHRNQSRQIAGNPYVILRSSITDTHGKTAGYIEEVLAVSAQELEKIGNRSYRMILAVFVIVLTTTLAIYPLLHPLVNQLLQMTHHLLVSNLEILQVLGSAIAKRDSDTDRHNFRVTIYAVRLAEAVNLSEAKIGSLIKGAFLHDVGKIGISDQILLKPGKLSPEEFNEMKNHVQYGIDIVKRSEWLKDAEDVVVHHHEQYGGNGYPLGIGGRAIPMTARIFSIVDVFDALTSARPYKQSMSCEKAIAWIKKMSAVYFDPALVVAFVSIAETVYKEIRNADIEMLSSMMGDILKKYFIDRVH